MVYPLILDFVSLSLIATLWAMRSGYYDVGLDESPGNSHAVNDTKFFLFWISIANCSAISLFSGSTYKPFAKVRTIRCGGCCARFTPLRVKISLDSWYNAVSFYASSPKRLSGDRRFAIRSCKASSVRFEPINRMIITIPFWETVGHSRSTFVTRYIKMG